MMDYREMELEELKEYAKSLGVVFGKIGKDKLIEKIKEKELEINTVKSVLDDEDLDDTKIEVVETEVEEKPVSLLDSITSVIDDLDDSVEDEFDEIVDLPRDTIVNVKSITYGGLTYKSRTNNAIVRWNQIGSIQPMTIGEINEMNNYKSDFLRKPLVILMDERAIKKFRLMSVYENVAKINNLGAVFKTGDLDKITKVIDDALSVNMRDILISKVRQMYKNKKLVDVNILRLLQDRLAFDILEDDI